jgi:hypothetical protein
MPEVLLDTGVWFGYFDENELNRKLSNCKSSKAASSGIRKERMNK